jgi:hypothetical protein
VSPTATTHDAVEAMDARFQERRQQVPVLAQRADDEGASAIRGLEDMIPLLFPHTTYKSYPESLIAKGKWAQMNRWLDSLSVHRVDNAHVDGVEDVDGWIERLHAAGHLVTSSSGTSGKSSFLNKSQRDREVSLQNLVDSFIEIGVKPEPIYHVVPTGPDTGIAHHRATGQVLIDNFSRPDAIDPRRDGSAAGHHRYMKRLQAMRRAMADGTADPDEIAAFEAEAAERQQAVQDRLRHFAGEILQRRDERFMFGSTFPLLYQLCDVLKEQGASPGNITGETALTTGGGLKGIELPEGYKATTFAMLNIDDSRFLHYYSMQELNVRMPKCVEGRYHVPTQHLVLFVLDKNGEALAPVSDNQAEGRAAYFDLTTDARWGGTISGDKIRADFGTCPCGKPGPTVFDEITRYSDLQDDDKITCAGTMDAYVRGFIAD